MYLKRAFNVGAEHYQEQHMRVLSPLFERHGVDFALHGHEHTYQRTKPPRFAPKDTSLAAAVNAKNRRVPGTFTLDEAFDGRRHTKPEGVIYYVTTGAGGKHLYDVDYTGDSTKWRHPDDNTAYVANFISARHSLTVFDLDGRTLRMAQIDENGQEIDRITVKQE